MAAFFFKDAAFAFCFRVHHSRGIFTETAFGIVRAVDDTCDLCPSDGTCTHGAGLYSDVEGAFGKILTSQRIGCHCDGLHFGMCSRVNERLGQVVGTGNHLVFAYHYGTNRYLAFFKGLAETCGGEFSLFSEPGKGTSVSASVQRSNIDTPPLGDIGEMMMETIQADGDIDYELAYVTDSSRFEFSTQEAKEMLDGVSILEPSVLLWIKEYINEGIKQVKEDIV